MFWTSKRLRCRIYERNNPVDLDGCTTSELLSLVSAIQEIWAEPQHSAYWYTVELFEKHSFFHESKVSIKISAFTLDPKKYSGKKQLSMKQMNHGRLLGEPILIRPKDTLTHSWLQDVYVVFYHK